MIRHRRPIVILVSLFIVTAVIVGTSSTDIPWNIRRLPRARHRPSLLSCGSFGLGFKWHAQQRGAQNELDALKEPFRSMSEAGTTIPSTLKSKLSLSSATTSAPQRFRGS